MICLKDFSYAFRLLDLSYAYVHVMELKSYRKSVDVLALSLGKYCSTFWDL